MRNIFPATCFKLEDCRTNLKMMKSAKNVPEFRAAFTSFLSSARATTNVLQKEGAHIAGFTDWYSVFQGEMRSDPLLRFIHTARISDFHKGKHGLSFSTHVSHFSTKMVGPPPSPNASMVMGADGIFWIADKGTPKERRVPIEAGKYRVLISIANPPTRHLEKTIDNPNPITICELALEYFESLIYKAKAKFGS